MKKKINQDSFGKDWDLIGSPEKSEVHAVVGAIINDSNLKIGLTAMQMDNIGYGYGKIFVQLYDENPTPVEVYNAIRINAQNSSKIWISRGLAEKMELRKDQILKVNRVLDEQGRIRYRCENQKDNLFGQVWRRLKQPIEGIVAAIDNDGYNVELFRIGLNPMQMDNLGIRARSEPLNNKTIMKVIKANEKGLLDGQNYGNLVVEFKGLTKYPQTYNAFGMRAIGGCGIRVSSTLAEGLGLKLEDKVKLYTQYQKYN